MNEVTEYIENFTLDQGQDFNNVDYSELNALKNIEKHIIHEFKFYYNRMEDFGDGEMQFVELDDIEVHVESLSLIFFKEISNFDFSVFKNLREFRIFFPPIDVNWMNDAFYLRGNDFGYYIPQDVPILESFSFPQSLMECKNLELILIENVPLTDLPDSIGRLSLLETLTLYNTNIRKLPDSIGSLSHLTYLQIYNGHITELPETIGYLENLQTLKVNKNPLVRIPSSIANCTKLLIIEFFYTSLNDLPASLFNHIYLYNLIKKSQFKGSPVVNNPKYNHLLKEGGSGSGRGSSIYLVLFIIFLFSDLFFFSPFLLLFDPYYKRYRKKFSDLFKDDEKSKKFFIGAYIAMWAFFSVILSPFIIVFFPIFVLWYIKKKIEIHRYKKRARLLVNY